MRKIFLKLVFAFLPMLCNGEGIFKFAEASLSSVVTTPDSSTEKQKSFKTDWGLKLSLDGLDARMFATAKKTGDEELLPAENFKYGLGIDLYGDSVPLSLKFGNLSFSRSFSKLKNPLPSATASPLAKTFSFSSGTGASLPSLSSSSQPQAANFAWTVPFSDRKTSLKVEGLLQETKESAISFSIEEKFTKSFSLVFSATGARFYIENNSTVLEKNFCSFEPQWLFAGMTEFSLKTPFLKLNFHSALHQSPYDDLNFWFKANGRTVWKNFLVDFSYFAIPTSRNSPKTAPLIGGSSSICRTLEQFSVNPQAIFLFNDRNSSSVRVGASFLNLWKITSVNQAVELQTAKIRGGLEFENRLMDFQVDFIANNILLAGTPPNVSSTPERYNEGKISFSISRKLFAMSASADYKNYPSEKGNFPKKESFGFSAKLIPGEARMFNLNAGFELVLKNREKYSGKFEAGGNCKLKCGRIHTGLKVQFEIPFQ